MPQRIVEIPAELRELLFSLAQEPVARGRERLLHEDRRVRAAVGEHRLAQVLDEIRELARVAGLAAVDVAARAVGVVQVEQRALRDGVGRAVAQRVERCCLPA